MNEDFELHPRLAADTLQIVDLALCRVRLMLNRAFPWVILVPRRTGITEIHRLRAADQLLLMEETVQVSQALERIRTPDKLNIGALGNLVPQLHVHVVARYAGDRAWPGPVWGCGVQEAYGPGEAEKLADRLASVLVDNR